MEMNKNLFKIAGVAAIAALLLLGANGCSKVNDLSGEAPAASSTYFVTLGADLPGTPGTRSAGVLTDGTWTLNFTDTDELFISGEAVEGNEDLYLAGVLKIVPESLDPGNPRHAKFAGELTVYEREDVIGGYNEMEYPEGSGNYVENPDDPWYETEYNEKEYDLSAYDNPLMACENDVYVTLIPSGDWSVFEYDNPTWVYHRSDLAVANSVEDLMASGVNVTGWFDYETESIELGGNNTILDIWLSGLAENAAYKIELYSAPSEDLIDNDKETWLILQTETPRTASATGTMHFVINAWDESYWPEDADEPVPSFYFLKLTGKYNDSYTVRLGTKTLENKVYKVERTAVADPVDETLPVVTGDFEYENYYRYFSVDGTCTVSGKGIEVEFQLDDNSTLCLNGADLSRSDDESVIYGSTFNIELQGDNLVSSRAPCTVSGSAIYVSGDGTLTVTSTYDDAGSFMGYYCFYAASGYTLTNSELKDNEDGTYTFSISVCPE